MKDFSDQLKELRTIVKDHNFSVYAHDKLINLLCEVRNEGVQDGVEIVKESYNLNKKKTK